MKAVDVESRQYIDFNKESKFDVGDHVRISNDKNIFAKDYIPNWSEDVFVIQKVKNTALWTCVINNVNYKEISGTFYQKELQKINQKEFHLEEVIKRKSDKLYVKWKGYNSFFNSWIERHNVTD